jgi:hypothetical protein
MVSANGAISFAASGIAPGEQEGTARSGLKARFKITEDEPGLQP